MPFCLQMAIVHGSGRPWKAMEGGIEFHDVKHALLGLEFSRTVRTRAGDVVKAGAQVLDRQWRSLKDYLPKTLATKSKAGHVNQSLWQWTYSWQYRYNNGKYLWTAVPHVLKHIRNAWVQNSPRLYGRRYLVFHQLCQLFQHDQWCTSLEITSPHILETTTSQRWIHLWPHQSLHFSVKIGKNKFLQTQPL